MNKNLPMMLAATGQTGSLPGVRITGENEIPRTKTDIGDTIEHLKGISSYLSTIINSKKQIQQYELEAIANQLRVSGMPIPTIFQDIASIFCQNYSRERRAGEKTVKESAEISRGYAKKMGFDTSKIPDRQIHGHNFGLVTGELENAVQEVLMKTLAYTQALTQMRVEEAQAYARGAKEIYRELHPFNVNSREEK